MGKAYESTIKAVLEAVDDKQKGMVEQINKVLAEFQNQIQQTLGQQSQNFVGAIQRALDIAYTGDVHLTVIRKFMFEKLGITEEEYNAAIEVEVQFREEMRQSQIAEHNARLEEAKKAAEEQKATDDESVNAVKAELGRLYAIVGIEEWEAQTTIQVENGILSLQCEGYAPIVGGVGYILEKLSGIQQPGEMFTVLRELAKISQPQEHSPELGSVTEDNEAVMFGGDYQSEEKTADVKMVLETAFTPVDENLSEVAKIGAEAILEELHRDPQNYGDEVSTTPPTDPDIE